ncbi:hypothetical protein [Brevundimonas sp.]|uniref:hypothetical protein n=1 Tax=Brevundimonas sp. TaxID=1871086 RepID=UPI00391AE4CE
MIALLLAILLQAAPTEAGPDQVLTEADACVTLEGRGVGVIGDQRLRGRVLARAIVARVPANRPVFISFANERASSDVQAMAAVSTAVHAANAPSMMIVETCDVAAGGASQ